MKKSSNYYVSPPPPDDFPNPNSISFFARQAMRAGYGGPDLMMRREFYRNPNPNPNPNLVFRDSIQRELEKEMIREEIIAEEVYRRRLLEEEVRREMMMERGMAMRRGGETGLRFGSTMPFRFQHRERITPLLTEFEHRDVGGSESRALPFQRDPVIAGGSGVGKGLSSSVTLKEIKETRGPVVGVNKDKVAIVAKPIATDLKRKAAAPLDVSPVDPSTGSKKAKSKDEWSCALCRVTATSERALNDHLQGKKHKSRESGLCSQRTGFGTGPLPNIGTNSLAKPIIVPGATNSPTLKKKRDGAVVSALAKVDESASLVLPAINQKSNLIKESESIVAERKSGETFAPSKPANSKPQKKYNFFCETCQVGTHKLKQMNYHKKGKRHLANVKKADKTKEISVEKIKIEEKKANLEPEMASFLVKGVVEETKEMDTSVANSTLEKGVVEEEKGMDTIFPDELNVKEVDEVKSSKESNDCDVEIEEPMCEVLECVLVDKD